MARKCSVDQANAKTGGFATAKKVFLFSFKTKNEHRKIF